MYGVCGRTGNMRTETFWVVFDILIASSTGVTPGTYRSCIEARCSQETSPVKSRLPTDRCCRFRVSEHEHLRPTVNDSHHVLSSIAVLCHQSPQIDYKKFSLIKSNKEGHWLTRSNYVLRSYTIATHSNGSE